MKYVVKYDELWWNMMKYAVQASKKQQFELLLAILPCCSHVRLQSPASATGLPGSTAASGPAMMSGKSWQFNLILGQSDHPIIQSSNDPMIRLSFIAGHLFSTQTHQTPHLKRKPLWAFYVPHMLKVYLPQIPYQKAPFQEVQSVPGIHQDEA